MNKGNSIIGLDDMIVDKEIKRMIDDSIGRFAYESGGILGEQNNIITAYHFDRVCSKSEYIPDINKLNNIIINWNENNINFVGIIHSHWEKSVLSYADIEYAKKILFINNIMDIHMFLYILINRKIIDYRITSDNFYEDEIIWG